MIKTKTKEEPAELNSSKLFLTLKNVLIDFAHFKESILLLNKPGKLVSALNHR